MRVTPDFNQGENPDVFAYNLRVRLAEFWKLQRKFKRIVKEKKSNPLPLVSHERKKTE